MRKSEKSKKAIAAEQEALELLLDEDHLMLLDVLTEGYWPEYQRAKLPSECRMATLFLAVSREFNRWKPHLGSDRAEAFDAALRHSKP